MKNLKKNGGFTLIEILVVIGIIAILAVIVLIAINPARQFAQARNTQRTSNVNAILNGIGQYLADNKGLDVNDALPAAGATGIDVGDFDLCDSLVPTYLPALPTDPALDLGDIDVCEVGGVTTDYIVSVGDPGSRVSVCADGTEEALEGSGDI